MEALTWTPTRPTTVDMPKLPRPLAPALLLLLIVVVAPGDAFDPDGVLYFRREPAPVVLAGLNLSEDSLRIDAPTRDGRNVERTNHKNP